MLRLIGAGMAVMTIDLADPPAALIENGEQLIEHLIKFGESGIGEAALDAAVTLWSDWRTTGLPAAVAITHVQALPGLLARYRPSRHRMIELTHGELAVAGSAIGEHVDAIRMAAFIVTQAQATGDLSKAQLSRQITFYLIERLFTILAPHRSVLWPLRLPMRKLYDHVRLAPQAQAPGRTVTATPGETTAPLASIA